MKFTKYFTSNLLITTTLLALLASCGFVENEGNNSSKPPAESPKPAVTTSSSSTTNWTSFSTAYNNYQTAIDALIKGIPYSAKPDKNNPEKELPKPEIATQFQGVADTLKGFRTASQEFQNQSNQNIVAKLQEIEAINQQIETVLILKDKQDEATVKALQTAIQVNVIDGDYGSGTRPKLVNYLTDKKNKITKSYNAIQPKVNPSLSPSSKPTNSQSQSSSSVKLNPNPLQHSLTISPLTTTIQTSLFINLSLLIASLSLLIASLGVSFLVFNQLRNQQKTSSNSTSSGVDKAQISGLTNLMESQNPNDTKINDKLSEIETLLKSFIEKSETSSKENLSQIVELINSTKITNTIPTEISNPSNLPADMSETLTSLTNSVSTLSEIFDKLNTSGLSLQPTAVETLKELMRTELNNYLTQQVSTIQPQITNLEQELNKLKQPVNPPTDPETSSTRATKYDNLTCPSLDNYFNSYDSLKDKIFVEPTEESLNKYKQNIIDLILQQSTASTPSSRQFLLIRHPEKFQEEDLYWLFIDPQLILERSNISTIRYFFKNQLEEYIKEDELRKTCKLSKPALVVEIPGTPKQWKLIKTGLMEMV